MATARPVKNSPLVLSGVFATIVCVVLGLGLVGKLDRSRLITGNPAAAPVTGMVSGEADRPQAVQRLADHPLLTSANALSAVTCELPTFDVDDDRLAAFYAAGVVCLDQAWGPLLVRVNLPFSPPTLDTGTDLTDGPCGKVPDSTEAVAYYCGRNQKIYMPTTRLRDNGGGDRPGSHLATLAHEYAHHVQAVSGMLHAADVKIIAAGETSPAGLEMSRRIELQANCFAGMFLSAAAGRGSVSVELARQAEEDFHYALREPEEKNAHGDPESQADWAETGFGANSTSACNTYASTPDAVR